ncbi:MAG: GNAT family N-acetyltransferase [Desulfobacterales bacterium]|nr:MAG: GNAT family N-acetyltransferase [Desulfobacterales bacterium]
MRTMNKIKRLFKHGLFFNAIFHRLSEFGFEIVPFYLFLEDYYIDSLANNLFARAKPKSSQWVIEYLKKEDMKQVVDISNAYFTYFTEHKLLEMLANGCICLGAKKNGNIIAFIWCNLQGCHEKRLSFPLKHDEAYFFCAFTERNYRGVGLAPYLRMHLMKDLIEKGRKRFYSINALFNTPAIKFKKKFNAKPAKLCLYVRFIKRYEKTYILKDYAKNTSGANNSGLRMFC